MESPREFLSETLFFRAAPTLRARLDEAAKRDRRERSEYIRLALEDWLAMHERLGDGLRAAIEEMVGRAA